MSSSTKQHLTIGIDPGSSSVKVAIMTSYAGSDGRILATTTQRIRRRNVQSVVKATVDEACRAANVNWGDFDYVTSTGDGDAVEDKTGHFYSMTTHARGALYLVPTAKAVLDIGALHARAIRIAETGRVENHRMTSQCASGSGQFLENIARYLGVPLDDVGKLSVGAKKPETVSSICAVLAETDVINMVSREISTADILKGIHLSIAGRLVRLLRAIHSEGVVLVTGGLAKDEGLLSSLNDILVEETTKKNRHPVAELTFTTHHDGILAGAIGAALLGAYRYEQLERRGRLRDVVSTAQHDSVDP
ncbi:MAG: benzoyl-CoA reductase subunit D [Myxococcales bacterium]|nr:benzoyl-CoA reductase subunit D [Myxococcales bacterium]